MIPALRADPARIWNRAPAAPLPANRDLCQGAPAAGDSHPTAIVCDDDEVASGSCHRSFDLLSASALISSAHRLTSGQGVRNCREAGRLRRTIQLGRSPAADAGVGAALWSRRQQAGRSAFAWKLAQDSCQMLAAVIAGCGKRRMPAKAPTGPRKSAPDDRLHASSR